MPDNEKKLTTLRTSISTLETETAQLEAQISETKAKLQCVHFREPYFHAIRLHEPTATVQRHIRLLHEYNEIKDIAQGLMGLIADARGVRQVEVQREFGVGERD